MQNLNDHASRTVLPSRRELIDALECEIRRLNPWLLAWHFRRGATSGSVFSFLRRFKHWMRSPPAVSPLPIETFEVSNAELAFSFQRVLDENRPVVAIMRL